MQQTVHMNQRMNQRGITMDMVDLALEYGEIERDRWVLNRKGVERTIKDLEHRLRTAKKVLDKGGVVVVSDGDALITAYNFNSKKRDF